jgi:hypothetical protein
MAKRLVLVVLAFLWLSSLVFAERSVVNSGGSLTFVSTELHGQSILISYKSIHATNLGYVAFTTGTLSSGSVEAGATFNEGGRFVIVANGTHGIPKGTIFRGKFTGTTTWTLVTSGNGRHSYTLTGSVQSLDGHTEGTTIQLTVNVGTGYFHKSAKLSAGNTALNP